MKKAVSVLLLLLLALSLTACGGGGEELTADEKEALNAARSEAMAWWCEKPFYGWWKIFDGDGQYADYIDYCWDCCAAVEPNTYNSDLALITVWDEDFNSYYSAALAVVELQQEIDRGDAHGALCSTGFEDNFMWNGRIYLNEWILEITDFENTVYLEGTVTDEYGESFDYGMLLCRWGEEWDFNAGDAPRYYESYFLPMMQADAELPYEFYPADGPVFNALPLSNEITDAMLTDGAAADGRGDDEQWYIGCGYPTETVFLPQETLQQAYDAIGETGMPGLTYEMLRDELLGGVDGTLECVTASGLYMFRWYAEENSEVYLACNFDQDGQVFQSRAGVGLQSD